MKVNMKAYIAFKPIIITLTSAFPYFLGSYPFFVFFNPDRTKWLKDNGFKGTDFDE